MRTVKSITVGEKVAAMTKQQADIAGVKPAYGGQLLPSVWEHIVSLVDSLAPKYGLNDSEVAFAKQYAGSQLLSGALDALI